MGFTHVPTCLQWPSDAFYLLLPVVAACTSAQVHVQAEEDARKDAEEGARKKAAVSEPVAEPNVASAAGTLPPPPPRHLEADLRELSERFVLCQRGFRDLSSGDLQNAECTWAEAIESQVFLREQPHLHRALLDSAGNPVLSALARDVAGADMRLTEALANFANAHALASAPGVAAATPGLFRLDTGLLASNPSPPVGFRPELAFPPFCGVVPVCSGSFFDSTCRQALVLVRDVAGMTYAVHAPRQDVAQFNSDCRAAQRRYGPVDDGLGRSRVVSAAASRTTTAPSGSAALEAAPQPSGFDDAVLTADDAHQHDSDGLGGRHQLPRPRRVVGSAQESDGLGGRRQPLRRGSSDAAVATPTRPEPTPPAPLVSPTNVPSGKYYRKRMIPKAAQQSSMVNDMMLKLEEHRIGGFGRSGQYGDWGYDDVAARKTLSAEGLAVRLGFDVPLRLHARV